MSGQSITNWSLDVEVGGVGMVSRNWWWQSWSIGGSTVGQLVVGEYKLVVANQQIPANSTPQSKAFLAPVSLLLPG